MIATGTVPSLPSPSQADAPGPRDLPRVSRHGLPVRVPPGPGSGAQCPQQTRRCYPIPDIGDYDGLHVPGIGS